MKNFFTKQILIAVIGVSAIFVAIFFGNKQLNYYNSPEQQILGTWEQTFEAKGQVMVPVEHDSSTEYLGFLKIDGEALLRKYLGSDQTQAISSINKWNLKQDNGKVILQKFSYYTYPSETPDIYEVVFLAWDEIALKKMNYEGTVVYETRFKRIGSKKYEHNKSFVRSKEESKRVCDSLFGREGSELDTPILLPISCTESVGNNEGSLLFDFLEKGGLKISRNDKTILYFSGLEDADSENAQIEGHYIDSLDYIQGGPFLKTSVIGFVDINYDGYSDLKVQSSAGAYNFYYDYYAYNPQSGTFDSKPILFDIINPEEDLENRTVRTFNKGRGMGDLYDSATYHFENGEYVLVSEEYQNFSESGCDSDCDYVHVVRELKNGKMSTTTDEIITAEELFR